MAIIGGKSRFSKPVAFKNAVVSIGDVDTDAYVASVIDESVVLGAGAKARLTAQYCVVIGENASSSGLVVPATPSNSNVVIGKNSSALGVVDCVVVGENAYADLGSDHSVVLGQGCSSTYDSADAVAIMPSSSTRSVILSPSSVFIGNLYGIGYQFGSSGTVGLGNAFSLSSTDCVILGNGLAVFSTQSVVVGFAVANTCAETVSMGASAAAENETGGVVIGAFSHSDGGTGIAIGNGASHLSSTSGISIGHGARVSGGDQAIAIGTRSGNDISSGAIVIGTDSNVIVSDWAVAIGRQVVLANSTDTVAIGTDIATGSQSYSNLSVLIGSHITSLAENTMLIGSGSIDGNSRYSQVIGRDVTVTNSIVAFIVGYGTVTIADSYFCVVMGFDTSLDNAPYSVALGYGNIIDEPSIVDPYDTGAHIAVGGMNQLLGSTYGASVFGQSNILSESAYSVVAGTENVVRNADYAAVLGHENNIPTGNSAHYALLIGIGLEVTAPNTITMGVQAINSEANTMVVGSSDSLGIAAIHSFSIKGNHSVSGPVDTISVTDNPSLAGVTGLTIVCQMAGVGFNRSVLAAVAPGEGTLYLYILP